MTAVDHYENFPVASVLCPPALRPAVTAIYHFARTADDLADEGDATPDQREADLQAYRHDLLSLYADQPISARWRPVLAPLDAARRRHALPLQPLADLLAAFLQDVRNPPYPDRAALLDYCSRSANPVGRLLLHLYGVHDALAQSRSDAICTALQLINFWQDLSVDLPRARVYVPVADAAAHGLGLQALQARCDSPETRALVRDLVTWARGLMHDGAPLVHAVPGRAGWELRLVVQGGLRILDKIEQMDFAAMTRRPTLGRLDLPALVWRALAMRP